MRQLLSNNYNENLLNLNIEDDKDLQYIPNISIKDVFDVTIYDDSTGVTSDKIVLLTDKFMRRAETDAILVEYKEIDECYIER